MSGEIAIKTEAAQANDDHPNLATICRLCLTEDSGSVDIFETNQKLSIPMRMMTCAALEVQASDSLPKKICKDCRIQLERFYYYRKKWLLADTKLRKHIRLLNTGKRSRVFEKRTDDNGEDDDDDDELFDSLEYLKEVDREAKEKEQEKYAAIEEAILEKVRQEEMDRIFEEAKNFFSSKLLGKSKKAPAVVSEEVNVAVESTTAETEKESSDLKVTGKTTTTTYTVNVPKEEEINDESKQDEDYSGSVHDVEVENYTLVNVKYATNDNVEITAIDLPSESEDELEEERHDSDDYNDEPASLVGDQSNSSNMEISYRDPDNMEIDEPDATEPSQRFEIEELEERLDEDVDDVDNRSVFVIQYKSAPNQPDSSELIQTVVPEKPGVWKIFKCQHCPQAFTRQTQLDRHASVHERLRGYKCAECEKWFACKSSLDRHFRTHTGEKPFQCDVCERRFIQKEILKRHLATHTGHRPYSCPHCDKGFVQKQMLKAHINARHSANPSIQLHECYLCPKTFCHASGLSRHLLTHSGVSYTCKVCDKKFSDKSAVKRHTSSVHYNNAGK